MKNSPVSPAPRSALGKNVADVNPEESQPLGNNKLEREAHRSSLFFSSREELLTQEQGPRSGERGGEGGHGLGGAQGVSPAPERERTASRPEAGCAPARALPETRSSV